MNVQTTTGLNDAASLSVNISQLKDLILMVSAFFFSFFLSLINDVNFCSCTQDIMKGRRVYFDQFFCMCSAQFISTDGKYYYKGPTPTQRAEIEAFFLKDFFFFLHTMTEALLNTALCYEQDTDDLQYVGNEGTG